VPTRVNMMINKRTVSAFMGNAVVQEKLTRNPRRRNR
jgi:hypothetical protein